LTKLEQSGGNQKDLLAKLKELNTDDQIAAMLAMQNELQQLRNEINEMKAKTPPLPAKPAVATVVTAPVVVSSFEYGPSFWLGILSSLLLLGLLGWRYFSRSRENEQRQDEVADAAIAGGRDFALTADDALPARLATSSNTAAPKPELGEITQKISAYVASQDQVSDEDLVVEEAQLYAAHNRPQKSIEMLGELIEAHPEKMDAWLSLFTNYASLNAVDQFASLAQKFKLVEHDEHTWILVQSLGRTLDRENPLYQEKNQDSAPVAVSSVATENANEPIIAPLANGDRFKSLEFDVDLTRPKKLRIRRDDF